jgi:hypothetical protein
MERAYDFHELMNCANTLNTLQRLSILTMVYSLVVLTIKWRMCGLPSIFKKENKLPT